MDKKLHKILKDFKKKVKQFQKVSQKDREMGKKLALELRAECKDINALPEINDDEKNKKYKKNFLQLYDSLGLYLANIKALNEFDKKWENPEDE